MASKRYVGRLAPSPTGALHLGNVRTFMVAWLRARSQGGKVIFRMEDLDHPKDKPGAAAQAVEDLKWLGFDWDAEYVQSERKPLYRSALEFLRKRTVASAHDSVIRPLDHSAISPLVYPCVCSRRDVEAAQSAPHAGEQLHYPGTCRGRFATWAEACAVKAVPCWRFRVPDGMVVRFVDAFAGPYAQDVAATLGDFPLARDEGGAGYTLACAVDDLLMGVTEVVRGDDLLPATPAQVLLMQSLAPWAQSNLPAPRSPSPVPSSPFPILRSPFPVSSSPFPLPAYLHVPLVVGADGKRLAKRHGDMRVAAFRAAGWRPEEILGRLAASCGWAAPGEAVSLRDLLPRFDLSTIPRTSWNVDSMERARV